MGQVVVYLTLHAAHGAEVLSLALALVLVVLWRVGAAQARG